ncbi:MAG TPA: AmmeMemoRadiSam system protein A [Polyangiaceae bacterium]
MLNQPFRRLLELATVFTGTMGCVNRANPLSEATPAGSNRPTTSETSSLNDASRPANSKSAKHGTETGSPEAATEGVMPAQAMHSLDERRVLLQLAHDAVTAAAKDHKQLIPPSTLPARLFERSGNFVTLTKRGQLRGCIGNIFPDAPLANAVATNAYRAALNDSRFPPVTPDELASIEIELSVLSAPQPLSFDSAEDLLRKLHPHRDGVVLRRGTQRSTFLPQVWEKLPSPVEFLDQLAAKAGMPQNAWRQVGTEILIYHVEAFDESEVHHGRQNSESAIKG